MSAIKPETIPKWAMGLHQVGLYFEGFVDDAPAVLEEYYKDAVTSFGVCDSTIRPHPDLQHKENVNNNEPENRKAKRYSS